MKTTDEIKKDLLNFRGSELTYFNPLFKQIKYTEGIRYLIKNCDAYWLYIEIVGTYYQYNLPDDFIKIVLTVKDKEAEFSFTDGNGNVFKKYKISITDFPLDSVTIFMSNKTIYLPTEH